MRGVAYGLGERVLLMKFREQGRSLQALSRETGVPRRLLSQRGKSYRDEVESRCCVSTCGDRNGRHDESRPGCNGAFRRFGVKEWAGMDRSGNGSATAAFVAAGEAACPLAAAAAVATTNRGRRCNGAFCKFGVKEWGRQGSQGSPRRIAAGMQRRIPQTRHQGVGLARIAGETGVPRRLLSQRGKSYRDEVESRCCVSTCGGRNGRHDESRPEMQRRIPQTRRQGVGWHGSQGKRE